MYSTENTYNTQYSLLKMHTMFSTETSGGWAKGIKGEDRKSNRTRQKNQKKEEI